MDEQTIMPMSDNGRAPNSRIKDSDAAYELFDSIKESDSTAAMYRCQIQGLIDGNPPYNPGELRKVGQGWRSNVNFREAESIIDTNAASIWELDMEVQRLINVELDKPDLARPGANFGEIIAEEYTRVLERWPDYFFNRMLCTREMLVTGIGTMFWHDKYDWRPRAAKRASLLIPPNSKATMGELELIGFRHTYQAHELYDKIKDDESKEAARLAGWNVDLVRAALIKASKNASSDGSELQSSTFEAMQQKLKNNDFAASQVYCNPVRVIQLLVKEYNGKVSRHIIYEDEKLPGYMYVGQDEYDGMEHAICFFVWNIGDGYYKSIKGLGHRIFPHVELSNRFINSTVDSAKISSSFVLERQGGAKNNINLMQLGSVTVIPDGFKPVQQSFTPNLTQLIGVRNMLHQILNNNTGVYKKQLEGPNLPERTATEVQTEERKSAKLEKNQISIHYLFLDAMHKEIYRRLCSADYPKEACGYKEAKEFQKRCKERGVSAEVLRNAQVTATRAIGFGSATMHDMITREVLSLSQVNGVDEIGRQNALRDRLAALVGYKGAERYVPEASRDLIPTSEHSLAMLENNDIMNKQQVIVGTDQPHAIHWQVHFPMLQRMAQTFMQSPQSLDLMSAVPAMEIGIRHLGLHLSNMARDELRKAQVEEMQKQLELLGKVFGAMQKAFEQMMKQRQAIAEQQAAQVQQAQQVLADREMQVKLAQIQKDFEVKLANVEKNNQIRWQRAINSMNIADMRAAADIRREDAKAGAAIPERVTE